MLKWFVDTIGRFSNLMSFFLDYCDVHYKVNLPMIIAVIVLFWRNEKSESLGFNKMWPRIPSCSLHYTRKVKPAYMHITSTQCQLNALELFSKLI